MALTVSGTAAQSFQFGLELEGVFVGRILSFAGGDAAADVVVEKAGADGVARKHLGAVGYEDISITCDANMADGFSDWLQQAFGRDVSTKNGAVVTYGANLNEVARLSFFNALVTEVGFPPLDGSAQDAAKLIVKITPERRATIPETRSSCRPQRTAKGGGGRITFASRSMVQTIRTCPRLKR